MRVGNVKNRTRSGRQRNNSTLYEISFSSKQLGPPRKKIPKLLGEKRKRVVTQATKTPLRLDDERGISKRSIVHPTQKTRNGDMKKEESEYLGT